MKNKAKILEDSLVNLVSGLGTSRDKLASTEFVYTELGREYLGILYRNWLFGKVVDIPADDMTRKWRTPKAPSLSIDDIQEFRQVEKDLDVRGAVNLALKWSRLYGGAAIIMNVDDGLGSPEDPLNLDAVTEGSLESLVVVDRYDLTPIRVNFTDVGECFRLPEFYQMANGGAIHRSRMILFHGFMLPWFDFQRNNYWGGSVAERVYDEILNAKVTNQSIASMIFEASVDVITVKGLFERIMNKKSLDAIIKRFQLANVIKSINKALVIDQDQETFQKHATNFGSLPNMISEYLSVVAGAADIPATRMLGQSAKGFSATGEGDLKNYYDMISSKQETDLYDALGQLDDVLVRSAFGRVVDDWDFEFNPLWQMTEKEKAEINKINMEADKGNLEIGSIMLSHVSARLLQNGVYPTLDPDYVEALEDMEELEAEMEAERMKAELEKAKNPPTPPTPPEDPMEGVEDPMDEPQGEGEEMAVEGDLDNVEGDLEELPPEDERDDEDGTEETD